MKPLTEWTTEEINDLLQSWDNHDRLVELLAELLRRERAAERERCAKECESLWESVATNNRGLMPTPDSDLRMEATRGVTALIANRLRALT